MNKKCFSLAFRTSLPVLFGYLAIGIAFGLMLSENDYPWWLAPIMSITMYAGAGQYVAIGLFAAGTKLTTILIAELLVNIRHIVYGLSLITKFNQCGKWKPYMIFALTDETYSLLTATDVPDGVAPGPFYGLISLLDQLYWVVGSIIGAVAGALIPFDLDGVDFALTALFTVLIIEQIQKTKEVLPAIIGAITTTLTIVLWKFNILKDSNNILLVALVSGIAAIIIVKKFTEKNTGEKAE